MTNKFSARLQFVLQQEGGYVDDPQDPGGVTDFGITLASWRAYTGDPTATPEDLRALTAAEKAAFYRAMMWRPVDGDNLPAGPDLMVFDHGVNAGPRRSAMILQHALGVRADGDIGPQTIAAAMTWNPASLITALTQLQTAYYRSLPGFAHDGRGWLARLQRRSAASQALHTQAAVAAHNQEHTE